jgi:non-specific protein-tyrosine kinase
MRTTPLYESTTKLFVNANASNDPGISNQYTGNLFTSQRVKTYQQIVSSPPVAQAVVDDLGLNMPPGQVAAEITADAPLDTVLLNIHVRDTDPKRAQRIADATAAAFTRLVDSLEANDQTGVANVKLSVVKAADLPAVPVVPNTKLNLALGILVGLALGIGLAVAREVLDTRVRNPEELEETFHLATLSVIGFDPGAKAKPLIVHDDPRSIRSEAFRRLRTNLQFVDVDKRPRSIVITSAVPGEGKSTLTCNLAISLADAGIDVVLIDGDLRRPAIADYLGLEGAVGLTNVLVGQVELDDALQPWGASGRLRVLTSGMLPPNPSELLGSRQMSDLVELLHGDALVLIDAPPLLPVTDAAVLAAEASGALLVVRAKSTRRDQLTGALESLRSVNAHVLGAVLNMAPTKGPDAYSYGYGYYGKYAARTDLPSGPHVAVDDLVSPRASIRPDDESREAMRSATNRGGPVAAPALTHTTDAADVTGADEDAEPAPPASPATTAVGRVSTNGSSGAAERTEVVRDADPPAWSRADFGRGAAD